MLTKSRKKWVVVLAVIMTVLLVAAACGDDDTPTPIPATPTPLSPGVTPPPATSTPVPEPTSTPEGKIFEGRKMKMAAYAGAFLEINRDVMGAKFEEETGGKIEWVPVFGEMLTLVTTSPEPPFDATVCFSADMIRGTVADAWEPLRYENIPNAADLTDFHTQTSGPGFDGIDLTYGVPFEYGIVALAYRKDLVPFEPISWDDLWRPEVAGQVGMNPVGHFMTAGITALILDDQPGIREYDSGGVDSADMDAIIDKLNEMDVALWFDTPAHATAAIERGDIAMFAEAAEQITTLVRQDPDKYAMVIPEEGTPGFMDYLCVVKGTENRDMAEVLFNYMLDPELQAEFAENIPYPMSNKNVVYGPNARQLVPLSEEELQSKMVLMDWIYITDNWDLIDERLRREWMTQ